jgi:hypothetical protein
MTGFEGPGYTMSWAGAQRRVFAGDLTPQADLRHLGPGTDLQALGPLAGLRGEVTVIDGIPHIATVSDGTVRVERSFAHQACFLVQGRVPRWTWTPVPERLAAWRDLASVLGDAVRAAGIDPEAPVPFRITGHAVTATFHVLDKRDGQPHDAARHEAAKVRFPLADEPVDIVGFSSVRHQGIFVPVDSTVHAHLVARDGRASGHVDAIHLAPGWRLGLPATDTREDRP